MHERSSSKRSPWSFILATLLVTVVLLLGILWPGNWTSPEHVAIGNLTSPEGWVSYDWEYYGRDPSGSALMKAWLGENYASHAIEISTHDLTAEKLSTSIVQLPQLRKLLLNNCEFNEAVAQALVSLPDLTEIQFVRMSPSAQSLKTLAQGGQIESLVFVDTQVTDDQLAAIGEFTHLKELSITELTGSDEGFAKLAQLTSLEGLTIDTMPKITDTGISQLKHLTQLEWLTLSESKATGRSLTILTHMPQLEYFEMACVPTAYDASLNTSEIWPHLPEMLYLVLDAACIDDQDLATIAHLPKLENLTLLNANITDRGIAELAQAKKLFYLELWGTHITSEGLSPLAQLPELYSIDISSDRDIELENVGKVNVFYKPFDPEGPRPTLTSLRELE